MGKFAWCTDVHLDFKDDNGIVQFATSLVASNPDGVIISGDISTAQNIIYHLSIIESVVQRRIYFVLGNHDYYGSSIDRVRDQMKELSNISQYLRYLPTSPYVAVTPTTALIGHDGWYDGLNGNWKDRSFNLTDWVRIKDFAEASNSGQARDKVVEVAQKLAHQGVMHIHDGIKSAVRYHKNVIVVTHVPPFPETHIFEGKTGDSAAQPWFTSKMMGDMLLDASRAFPKVMFTVLAGHTHGKYDGKITDNLYVHVGDAEYGRPKLQQLIDAP